MTDPQKKYVSYMMPMLDEAQRQYFLGAVSDLLGQDCIGELSQWTDTPENAIIAETKRYRKRIQPDPRARKRIPLSVDCKEVYADREEAAENAAVERELFVLLNGSPSSDPQSLLCWTTKSLDQLSEALQKRGLSVTQDAMAKLLQERGFSLTQSDPSGGCKETASDWDTQFRYAAAAVTAFVERSQPVLSLNLQRVEAEKDFETASGTDARSFCIGNGGNAGAIAVSAIRNWWYTIGESQCPEPASILIVVDSLAAPAAETSCGSRGCRHLPMKSTQIFGSVFSRLVSPGGARLPTGRSTPWGWLGPQAPRRAL